MKGFVLLAMILAAAAIASNALAQPITPYIIPDIGTPGMNTYVEIIAPANEPGKFLLPDGLVSPAQMTVQFINPADSQRIRVSPGVISWNQRMAAFQFFVKPNAAPGPVPIRLWVQGSIFPLDTFFIVAPQHIGTKSGGGTLGGAAVAGTGLGRRSKRGAMIVDSLILSNGTYTIDVSDHDPDKEGNQGYLPCIILSRGRIVVDATARISASAPSGSNAKNGGPGGGGGGGYGATRPAGFPIPIAIDGEVDVPLGDGFTGGTSNVPLVPSPGGAGTGSGRGAAGLNGVIANDKFSLVANNTVRLFSGGPGHPFDNDARSGGAAVATGTAPPDIFGTYYGGGGNATKGTGLPAAQDAFNGQVIGNMELVPLHGGSGGASGGTNDSVGGGGGGAVALYSEGRLIVENAQARGGDGRDGCNSCGLGGGDASAGGSGGAVVVGSKLSVRLRLADVRGGIAGTKAASALPQSTSGAGGAGRIRVDGVATAPGITPADATLYAGPTTDTLTFSSARLVRLHGSGRRRAGRPGDSIAVYVRGENSDWNFFTPTRALVAADGTWQADITLPNDTLAYVFALQAVPQDELVTATPYTNIPTHIFSQASANIIRLDIRPPAMTAPTTLVFDTVRCPGAIRDTFTVGNTGIGPLIIDAASAFSGPNATRYRLIAPKLPDTLAPGGTRQWIVELNGDAAANGSLAATLTLVTNDPAKGTWPVAVDAQKAAQPAPTLTPPSAAFGSVTVGASVQRTIVITNIGTAPQQIGGLAIAPATPGLRVVYPTLPPARTLAPGDTMQVVLEFAPTGKTTLTATKLLVNRTAPCNDLIEAAITGQSLKASLVASRDPLIITDTSCTGFAPAEDTIRLINTGSAPVSLTALSTANTGIFSLVPPVPSGSIPAGGSVVVRVRYTPAARGTANGTLNVTSTDPDRPSFGVVLGGISDSVFVQPSTHLLQFRTMLACETTIDSIIWLANTWGDTVRLVPVNIDPPFSLGTAPPYIIAPGDTFRVRVTLTAGINGTFNSRIVYTANPCGRRDTIVLRGERVDVAAAATDVALGDVTVGGTGTASAVVSNSGPQAFRIASASIAPPYPGLSVNPAQFPLRVATGGSTSIAVDFAPTAAGSIPAGTQLTLTIDSLCAGSVSANVTGRGIPGGVSLDRSALDFGALQYCRASADTIRVANISNIAVTLGTPTLAGTNFTIGNGTFTPGALQPTASVTLVVNFAPGPGPDAQLRDTIRITSDDPLRPLIEIPLAGARISTATRISPVSFINVDAGSSATSTATIVNTGSAPIFVDAVAVGAPFSAISTQPPLPAIVKPGDTLAVTLEFSPTAPGSFDDVVRFTLHDACDSLSMPVSGDAVTGVTIADAVWGDVSGAPGEVVRIPLRLASDLSLIGLTSFEANLRFNPSLLLPLAVGTDGTLSAGWTATMTRPAAGTVHIAASGGSPLAGTGLLAYVDARVMLGDSIATTISGGDSLVLASPRAVVRVAPGLFTLNGYCTVGGPRLIDANGTSGLKSVRPNPTTGRADVEFTTVERGTAELRLYDRLGRAMPVVPATELAPGTYIVTLDAADLPAGVYYLELRTPHDRDRTSVVIVK